MANYRPSTVLAGALVLLTTQACATATSDLQASASHRASAVQAPAPQSLVPQNRAERVSGEPSGRELVDLAAIADLDHLAEREDYQGLVTTLLTPGHETHLRTRQIWMEDRLRLGVASVVLAQPYARLLKDAGRDGDMHFWYLYGTITLQIDAARCADRSAPLRQVAAWSTATADLASAFSTLSTDQQAQIGAAALAFEDSTAAYRLTDRWLCSQGVDYWNAYFAKYPSRRGDDRASLPRDLEIGVYAVPDRVWQSKRARIRDLYARALIGETPLLSTGRGTL